MSEGARFDLVIDRLKSEILTRTKRTASAFRTEQPPRKTKIPQDEQLKTYLQMRDVPEAWGQLVQEKGVRQALNYFKKMEGLAERRWNQLHKDFGSIEGLRYRKAPVPEAIIQSLLSAVDELNPQQQPMQQPMQPMQPPMQPPMSTEVPPDGLLA